ncbi:MAG TPA: rhomboid family intramembrane serine protease [Nocardioides sp.]|jgi:membrane associated rhomboid family serine protease|nr:rhomboid family intramembrane serine protease [Nocardioides sp.]
MNDASVGFHCPDCVAEAARTTRQARTPYGGLRASRHGVVSLTLIAVNAFVWVLIVVTGWANSPWVYRLALIPQGQCTLGDGRYFPGVTSAQLCALHPGGGTTWYEGVATGAWWQPLTSMFTQVELLHIGFNMIALWVLGPQLELVLGRLRYTSLYLLSGLVGSAVVYWFSDPTTPTLGASGAIFGLMGALLVLALKVGSDLNQLLMWIGINFALTFFANANISWQGHLGGFVGGMVLAAILAYAPRNNRPAWQAAGFAGVAVLVVLAFLVRTAALT